MSAVFPEVTIEWAGVEHDVKVTLKTINKIEQTVSIASLVNRMQTGDVALSHLATIYGCLLRSADVRVSDDEVYAAMYGQHDESELSQEEVIKAASSALVACIPQNAPKSKKKKAST